MKKINLFKLISIFYFCVSIELYSASIVYNLRIAETTRRQALQGRSAHPFIAAVTLFDQLRAEKNGAKYDDEGGLGTLLYSPKNSYLRVDFAVARVHEKFKTYHFSKVEPDDVLFSFGYSHSMSKRFRMTASGLFGIPTGKDTSIQKGIMFGTGHFGIGAQIDSLYAYSKNLNSSIMSAVRIIHFFKRKISVEVNNQINFFDYNIGNLADILIAHNSSFGNHHKLELGYNLTILFNANIKPHLKNAIEATNFMQSSFYASYNYNFLISRLKSALILGLSYGLGHLANQFRTTYALTFWATFGISF